MLGHGGRIEESGSNCERARALAKREPLEERSERREPLVVAGPHKYVRHPLYFGVVVMVLGWAVVSDRTFVLLSTGILFAWFRLVIAPYEEKELKAIFGHEYAQYSESVPSMIPFTRVRTGQRARRVRRVCQSIDLGYMGLFINRLI
jgi:uncharacterized membrane protein